MVNFTGKKATFHRIVRQWCLRSRLIDLTSNVNVLSILVVLIKALIQVGDLWFHSM